MPINSDRSSALTPNIPDVHLYVHSARHGGLMTYHATATSTGNSKALRLDAALLREHPEFAVGQFEVDVIAPGRLLVRALRPAEAGTDPVFHAFFAFLDNQMALHPERITALSARDIEGVDALLDGVVADQSEHLGDSFEMP